MRRLVSLFSLVCSSCFPANAQDCLNTGTLAGVVLDPTGAVVQGATIQISSTGELRRTLSGRDGRWTISCLTSGAYQVQVNSTGFQSTQLGPLQVSSDKSKPITTKLLIASVTQNVDVASTDASSQSGGANVLSEKSASGFG